MSKVKSLATLAKEMRKLRKKPTQEGVKFGTKKDMVMAKDTPFSKDLDVKVIAGREGKSERAGKINIGDDVVGFNNFLKMQQSKSGLSRAKFKEKLNQKRIFSILLVLLSIMILIFLSLKSLPWVGLIVALSWAFYNLVRKKIYVDTDIGLLIESLYILPIALIVFYMIIDKGVNDFNIEDPSLMLFLTLAGPMTVIPLFYM